MYVTPKLALFRQRAMLSQRELAALAEVRQATISGLEHGATARPQTIRKLARALGVETGMLAVPAEVQR